MPRLELELASASGPHVQRFSQDVVRLGRAPDNDFVLADSRISGVHGRFVWREGRCYYQDLQSTNGSLLERAGERFVIDGRRFPEREVLADDTLLLGAEDAPVRVRIVALESDAPPDPTRTVLASRTLNDFTVLSGRILGDKSLIRALFRFQKELSEQESVAACRQLTARTVLNHLSTAEYVVFHEEDGGAFAQRTFTSKTPDIAENSRLHPRLLEAACREQRSLLFAQAELEQERRRTGQAVLQSLLVAPLIAQGHSLGVLEVGNTPHVPPLEESDLDLLSVLANAAAARLHTLALVERLRRAEENLATENRYLKTQLADREPEQILLGESAALKTIRRQIATVAPSDLPVLILGETGTGKELVARAIHAQSPRRDRLFAALNGGAISESLLESELFGHMKGAFTGAVETKKGMFEVADGGTLFLDEIGEMPYALQVKLLRVLQEGEVLPVGATVPKRVNVRLLCATNRDLAAEVAAKRFREDLFYRINAFPIRLPALRERGDDIPLLAEHFLAQFSDEMGRPGHAFSAACLKALARCAFPGNIRQLKNEVQRALLLAEEGEAIEIYHFSPAISQRLSETAAPLDLDGHSLKSVMEAYEIRVIRAALEENGWNRSHTAQKLGLSRQAFMAKLAKYGISPDD